MKYIKYLMIFFVIIIFLISILLFMVLNNSGNTGNKYNNIIKNENNIGNNAGNNIANQEIITDAIEDEEYDIELELDNKLSYVENRVDYFTISSLYDSYINQIANKNSKWLKNTLSPSYIVNYEITDENIFDKLTIPAKENSTQYYKSNITEMLTTQVDDTIHIYIVKGTCRISESNTIFSVQVMFEIDSVNQIYNIYPYQYIKDNGYDILKNGDILNNYQKDEIKNNKDNTFSYIIKTDADMATEYFNNYKELIQYYPTEAYSKLNSEYAQKRFGSLAEFQKYLQVNSEVLLNMEIDKYKVYSTQNYTDYICSDKYENLYIFRQQNGIMRYTTFLDNYTILTDYYSKEYNKLDKFEKGKYNLTKFINMVNTKDYAAIYNVLDNTFKNNNFKTQQDLEKFVKDNMYSLNKIEIDELEKNNYEYYVFECKLINLKNNNQNKNMTIIIKQGEGTDFTMSFSFEE